VQKKFGGILMKKIKSMLYGFAVADALGVPVEFKSRKFLQKNPVVGMQGFGTYNQPAGTWSDDTLSRVDYGETKKERQQNQYLFDFAN